MGGPVNGYCNLPAASYATATAGTATRTETAGTATTAKTTGARAAKATATRRTRTTKATRPGAKAWRRGRRIPGTTRPRCTAQTVPEQRIAHAAATAARRTRAGAGTPGAVQTDNDKNRQQHRRINTTATGLMPPLLLCCTGAWAALSSVEVGIPYTLHNFSAMARTVCWVPVS